MVHDVVEIDANSKLMGHLNHLQELGFGAPVRSNRSALVLVAQIEGIEEIVSDGGTATALGGRRQPEAGVAGFGDFGHFLNEVVPGNVKKLEHGVPPDGRNGSEKAQKGAEAKSEGSSPGSNNSAGKVCGRRHDFG